MQSSKEYSGLISFTIDWFDLLAVQGTLKSLLQHHSSKASILQCFFYGPTLLSIHDYWKNHSFDYLDCCWENYVLLFNMLCRFVRAFLPKSRHLLFHGCSYYMQRFWRPRKYNLSLFPLFPLLFAMKWWDKMPWFGFEMLTFKPLFHSPLSPSSGGSLNPLGFLPIEWYCLHIWGGLYFSQQSWFQLVIHPTHPFTWCTLHRN